MNHAPKISIVTPVLNGEKFIDSLVDSLMRQSMTDWEHIVVDGGSTDSTRDRLKRSYEGDDRFTWIEAPGEGQYASVLIGMRAAKSHILGWQNADDLYTPWAFQAVVDFHNRTKSNWMTGLPGCWDSRSVLRFVRPYGWYPRSMIKRGWFHAELLGFLQQESMFLTRHALDALNDREQKTIADSNLAGDFIFWKLLAQYFELEILPNVVSGFRRHDRNRSHEGIIDYMAEVRAHGGKTFPGPVASIFRKLFRAISALSVLRRVEREDQLMTRDFGLDRE